MNSEEFIVVLGCSVSTSFQVNVRSNNKSSLGALLRASAALEHRMLSEGSSSKLLGSDRSIQESCS